MCGVHFVIVFLPNHRLTMQGSRAAAGWWCLRARTAPTCWTLRFCAPAASTVRSTSICQTSRCVAVCECISVEWLTHLYSSPTAYVPSSPLSCIAHALQGRLAIFRVHLRGIKAAEDKEALARQLATLTPGFSGEQMSGYVAIPALILYSRSPSCPLSFSSLTILMTIPCTDARSPAQERTLPTCATSPR